MSGRFRFHASSVAVFLVLVAARALAQAPVTYAVTVPEPAHRWLQVSATFPEIGAEPLRLQMSRSSPGRYALHEFAKNLFEIKAYDGKGLALAMLRVSPHEWTVSGHDGTVRVEYKLYGDRVDGTYLAVDTTHIHMNMPATFLWAHGLESRSIRIRFVPPDPSWQVATQLFPTGDPTVFTAPNLQYFMDSPTEVGPFSLRRFVVENPDGKRYEVRIAVHHTAHEADATDFATKIEKIVREQQAVFGELPDFDGSTYTFIADYLPYVENDAMEHRNSTILTSRLDFGDPRQRLGALGTASHEFFHGWNVERIRPADLEPFDLTKVNMSDGLWLAEGFTSYYGPLTMMRAGLWTLDRAVAGFGRTVNAVVNGPGRQFRSAVAMSRMAPFVDAARSVDRTNLTSTFISYYTWGAAIGLGLDLMLRVASEGKVTLDDYMRALWRQHGKPDGPAPGLVARPYTLRDARDRLAEVSGSRAFANEFFDRYVEGREVADYAALLEAAGLVLRLRNPQAAWMGQFSLDGRAEGLMVTSLVPPGSPAHAAGLEQDDVILALDADATTDTTQVRAVLERHVPGDRIGVRFVRRGAPISAVITLQEDPSLELVTVEATGGRPTEKQLAFRDAWLGSQIR
jgi:predicted metalloprotease with PDZ domain